jgi:hypothetical protein
VILHWLNTELWAPMWPNMFAPSVITLAAVVVSHVKARRQRDRHQQDLKKHVTATAGAAVEQAEQRTTRCIACGDPAVPVDETGKIAVHDQGGVTCVASGWTIREK